MTYRYFLLVSCAILLISCGGGGGSGGSANQSSEAIGNTSRAVTPEPDMIVNLDTREVYLSTIGWLSEADFWDIYYNDPQRLPSNMDFEGLAKLQESSQIELH